MAGSATENEKQAFLDDFAGKLSFPPHRMSMVTTARDTREEVALACAAISNTFSGAGQAWPVTIVATSASHIPRSLLLFNKVGVMPIAAPCDYQIREKEGWFDISRIKILNGNRLMNIQVTLHEGIGLIYTSLLAKTPN